MSSYQVLSGGYGSKAVKKLVERTIQKKIAAINFNLQAAQTQQPQLSQPSVSTSQPSWFPFMQQTGSQIDSQLSQPVVTAPSQAEAVAEGTTGMQAKAKVPWVLVLGLGFMAFKFVMPMIKKGK